MSILQQKSALPPRLVCVVYARLRNEVLSIPIMRRWIRSRLAIPSWFSPW